MVEGRCQGQHEGQGRLWRRRLLCVGDVPGVAGTILCQKSGSVMVEGHCQGQHEGQGRLWRRRLLRAGNVPGVA